MARFEKIPVKGLRNCRDVGQVYNTNGQKVKSGVLFRSSRLDKMPVKRIKKFLKDYNINAIIDLRTQVEVNESKHFTYPNFVDFYHIPVLNQQFFGITHEANSMAKVMIQERHKITKDYTSRDYMISMYKSIIFEPSSQRHFKTIFDLLCEEREGALLYHCTGGKDRTGITTMFLYTVLGVSEEDILAEYEVSDVFNASYNRLRHTLMTIFLPTSTRVKALLTSMLYSKREYMEETIAAIKEKYGTVLNYLETEIGITKEKQDKLKELYLEK
jgi:protein-tyrosine phosphatase